MTDKELRRLGRRELLEMLLAHSKEVQALQTQLEAASLAHHKEVETLQYRLRKSELVHRKEMEALQTRMQEAEQAHNEALQALQSQVGSSSNNDQQVEELQKQLKEAAAANKKEIQALKKQLKEADKKLAERKVIVAQAGSLAEAALKLSGIFESAQQAADLYLENLSNVGAAPAEVKQEGTNGPKTRRSKKKV